MICFLRWENTLVFVLPTCKVLWNIYFQQITWNHSFLHTDLYSILCTAGKVLTQDLLKNNILATIFLQSNSSTLFFLLIVAVVVHIPFFCMQNIPWVKFFCLFDVSLIFSETEKERGLWNLVLLYSRTTAYDLTYTQASVVSYRIRDEPRKQGTSGNSARSWHWCNLAVLQFRPLVPSWFPLIFTLTLTVVKY